MRSLPRGMRPQLFLLMCVALSSGFCLCNETTFAIYHEVCTQLCCCCCCCCCPPFKGCATSVTSCLQSVMGYMLDFAAAAASHFASFPLFAALVHFVSPEWCCSGWWASSCSGKLPSIVRVCTTPCNFLLQDVRIEKLTKAVSRLCVSGCT